MNDTPDQEPITFETKPLCIISARFLVSKKLGRYKNYVNHVVLIKI